MTDREAPMNPPAPQTELVQRLTRIANDLAAWLNQAPIVINADGNPTISPVYGAWALLCHEVTALAAARPPGETPPPEKELTPLEGAVAEYRACRAGLSPSPALAALDVAFERVAAQADLLDGEWVEAVAEQVDDEAPIGDRTALEALVALYKRGTWAVEHPQGCAARYGDAARCSCGLDDFVAEVDRLAEILQGRPEAR